MNNNFNNSSETVTKDFQFGSASKPSFGQSFRHLSQKFESELSFGAIDTNGLIDSRLDPFAKEYEDRSHSHWKSNNGWNNGSTNGWMDHSFDSKSKEGMRPIIKTSVEIEYLEKTTPIGSSRAHKNWYNTYAEETKRFDQMNGKSDKRYDKKHVRFEDHYSDTKGTDDEILGTSCSSMGSSNGFGFYEINDRNSDINERKWREDNNRWDMKGSIVESLYNGVLKPAADNFQKEFRYGRTQWNRNMANIRNTLNNSSLFGDSIWSNSEKSNNSFMRFITDPEEGKSKIHNLFAQMKKTIPKCMANYTWSGQLPRKIRTKNQVFSVKVFLGGIPYDLTDSDLHCTFAQFGHIQIQWPGKDIRSAIDGAAANKAGYVYIIFETYENVAALLSSCTISYRDLDSNCRMYYNISSRRQKAKEVQVIPFDIGDRFFMKSSFVGQMEQSRTVFVGGLHGMLSADGLAKVMDDLFGGVIFAGLDTDKFKYPLGSGRVIFDNQESYLKAVSAAFVEIKSARFKKRIQIDPYIENESQCSVCKVTQQSPIFCREEFLYFCNNCWELHHSDPDSEKHRPIVKTKTSNI